MAEQETPGLGMLGIERMRGELAAWSEHARDALDRHDWKAAFLRYPHLDLRAVTPPFAAPPADLRRARVMLIGSAGVYAPGQEPFDSASWRRRERSAR